MSRRVETNQSTTCEPALLLTRDWGADESHRCDRRPMNPRDSSAPNRERVARAQSISRLRWSCASVQLARPSTPPHVRLHLPPAVLG